MTWHRPDDAPNPPAPPPGLASVILSCSGRPEHTRRCIATLSRTTRRPWELIVIIDGGAAGGMAEYFRGLRDAAAFPVDVIEGTAGRARAMAAAAGRYLVLLGDEVVVTDSWLDQLIALADSGPTIGMSGPMSNDVDPPQLAEGVPDGDLEAMHRFASRWRSEHRGRWSTAEKLAGSCVLVKRAAFEAAGGPGSPDDLASRVRRAGYDLAVAHDLVVHRTRPDPATAGRGVAGHARPPSSRPGGLPQGSSAPTLVPGSSREMVNQSLAILASFGGNPAQKAALWERLAAQIIEHGRRNGSTWGMERLPGADDSIIYMGRASEFLVFDASGGLFRGQGAGCLAGSRGGGLVPHFPAMRQA